MCWIRLGVNRNLRIEDLLLRTVPHLFNWSVGISDLRDGPYRPSITC